MSFLKRMQDATKAARTGTQFNKYAQEMSYMKVFKEAEQTKAELIKDISRIRDSYIVGAILSVMSEDVLAPDITTGNILDVRVKGKKAKTAIKELQEVINFDILASEVTDEILLWGDYTYSLNVFTNEKGNKILRPVDNVNQSRVFAFYEVPYYPKYFMYQNQMGDLRKISANKMVHFCLSSKKIRVRAANANSPAINDNSEYSRIGRSIFYHATKKIESLALLDVMPVAKMFSQIGLATLITVQVPESMDVEKAHKLCRKTESMLNQQPFMPEMNANKEITAEQIIAAARFKCIPQFGEKGEIRKIDIPRIETDISRLDELQDARQVICSTVGVPFNFLYSGQERRYDSIRLFSRYARKLRICQQSIAHGVRQICLAFLALREIAVTPEDIEVDFVNKLVAIDELDKLEYMDTLISTVSNATRLFSELSEMGFPDRMEPSVVKIIQKLLRSAGIEVSDVDPLITPPEEEEGGGGRGRF